jgi:hypothetical protein
MMREIKTAKISESEWYANLELAEGARLYASGKTEEEAVAKIKEMASHRSIIKKYGKVL